MKIAAIVPVLNEEKNIGNVLKALLDSGIFNEVMIVDSGSTDKTVDIAKSLKVNVVTCLKKGKGNAMLEGLKNTDAEIVLFCDGDLIGFNKEHIFQLLSPVINQKAAMAVGIRERRGGGKIAEFFIKIDPLFAIAGERALRRNVFEDIPVDFIKGFMVETSLNYYCKINKLPVVYIKLRGLSIMTKERKQGFLKGFFARIKMYIELVKIRILIYLRSNEFKKF